MVTCPNCQSINKDTAKFCSECGTRLQMGSSKSNLDENIRHFEEEVNRFGKKVEQAFDKAGHSIETWYDRTFGPFGPVLSTIIALLLLFIVLRLLGYFGQQRPWLIDIQFFIDSLLYWFVIVFLVTGFSQYFSKKSALFRFISPVIGALVFIFWFWIALNIISIFGKEFDVPFLIGFTDLFEILLVPLAFLILIIGYISILSQSMKPTSFQSTEPVPSEQRDRVSQPPSAGEYKRLFRSGRDRLVGGVLGGIGEYFNVDPTIIRIVFIVLLLASFGTMVLAYIVGWIIIPRNPYHHW